MYGSLLVLGKAITVIQKRLGTSGTNEIGAREKSPMAIHISLLQTESVNCRSFQQKPSAGDAYISPRRSSGTFSLLL
jgi:hypothetical protein